MSLLATLPLALPLAVALVPPADEDVLRNGDFESGGKTDVAQWSTIQPPGEDASFLHPEGNAHGGKRCGTISTPNGRGYTSFTQRIDGPPRGATVAKLGGWIRVDSAAEGGSANLMLLFHDQDENRNAGMFHSTSVREVGDWTYVEVEVPVPAEADWWLVRCGVSGVATVSFDDVTLEVSKEKLDATTVHLAEHHATYVVRTKHRVKEPWIRFSVPFPFEGQTPLGVRVTSEPPGAVARLEVVEDEENRPLQVVLRAMDAGEEVHLRAETLVLIQDRVLSDGKDVELAPRKKIPRDVRPYLDEAPGIDLENEIVQSAARELDRSDLFAFARDLNATLEAKLEYDGGRPQGATECLAAGKAVCTGYANVAASFAIAADTPARILACTQLSGRLQEHYIIQLWTPALGWSRLESTMARFPWRDSANLILRVVYPGAWRSAGDVPLYVQLAEGVQGGFDMQDDTCWQGADGRGTLLVDRGDVELVTDAARDAFEALRKKPAEGAALLLAPSERPKRGKLAKTGKRTDALFAAIGAWFEE